MWALAGERIRDPHVDERTLHARARLHRALGPARFDVPPPEVIAEECRRPAYGVAHKLR